MTFSKRNSSPLPHLDPLDVPQSDLPHRADHADLGVLAVHCNYVPVVEALYSVVLGVESVVEWLQVFVVVHSSTISVPFPLFVVVISMDCLFDVLLLDEVLMSFLSSVEVALSASDLETVHDSPGDAVSVLVFAVIHSVELNEERIDYRLFLDR